MKRRTAPTGFYCTQLGIGNIPRNWTITHTLQILQILRKDNIEVSIYKDLERFRYILKYERCVLYFKTNKEICEFLLPVFQKTKDKIEGEILNKMWSTRYELMTKKPLS